MADGLAVRDVDDSVARLASRVASRTGPGPVRKPAGSAPYGELGPPSDATLQCLEERAALNTFGLGNVRANGGRGKTLIFYYKRLVVAIENQISPLNWELQ